MIKKLPQADGDSIKAILAKHGSEMPAAVWDTGAGVKVASLAADLLDAAHATAPVAVATAPVAVATAPVAVATAPVVTLPAGATQWLHTEGNRIMRADGSRWVGHGVNLFDTRSCNAAAYQPPNIAEAKRRIDDAVGVWGATFLRLCLESYLTAENRVHYQDVQHDPNYLSDVVELVKHVGTKPGVYVMVSLWQDPTFGPLARPTQATADSWAILAKALAPYPHAIYGICNEPEGNYNGSDDGAVFNAMQLVSNTIRGVEASLGSQPHLISVQGTRSWGRYLGYYPTHQLGANHIYETHVYDPQAQFAQQFEAPAATLPVIIGEFGYVQLSYATMSLADCQALVDSAKARSISWAAWAYHMRAPPSLLVDNSNWGSGVGMTLTPADPWGVWVKNQLGLAKA